MGYVPPMEHERVAVRVVEERHVTDPGVEDLALELDALRLELAARLGDVGHTEGDVVRVRGEGNADLLRLPNGERHLAGAHLEAAAHVPLERETERAEIEASRALYVLRDHGEKVDLLDFH